MFSGGTHYVIKNRDLDEFRIEQVQSAPQFPGLAAGAAR